jgi:hypothetical protein
MSELGAALRFESLSGNTETGGKLTFLGQLVAHVQGLRDGGEEWPERELVNDMGQIHHCTSALPRSFSLSATTAYSLPVACMGSAVQVSERTAPRIRQASIRSELSETHTSMIRMFPAHIPMPQRSDMQVPSRLLDHDTAIQPARFASLYQRHRRPESGILRPTTAVRPAKNAECE